MGGRALAKLEVEDAVTIDGAQRLACTDLLTAADADTGEVGIDGDIAAMTHHDTHHTTDIKDGTHLTVEDAAGHGTGLSLDVDAFVVELHTLQTFDSILTEAVDDASSTVRCVPSLISVV